MAQPRQTISLGRGTPKADVEPYIATVLISDQGQVVQVRATLSVRTSKGSTGDETETRTLRNFGIPFNPLRPPVTPQ